MSESTRVDAVVVGAGTAGLKAFTELRRRGLSTLLVDHGPLGTTCARVGCMPSKAVLHAGRQWADLRALAGGAQLPPPVHGPDALWRHARRTRDRLAADTVELTKRVAGDALVMGSARFTGPDTLDVDGRAIRAGAFVVATGSRPVVPPALQLPRERLLTTDTLFELETLPARVGILGLGAIGLEIGLALSRLGVRVVAGDLKPLPAGIADPEVGARAIARFATELTMWLGRPVEAGLAGNAIEMRSGDDRAEVDVVIAALGRRPELAALDLRAAGVALDPQGRPAPDPRSLRVGTSRVFLAGDASNLRPLMHEASDEGAIAAAAAAQSLDGEIDVAALPSRRTPLAIVFSDPDVASVGRGWNDLDPDRTIVGTALGTANGRSRVIGETGNLLRVYASRRSGRLLGASLVCSHGEHLAHLIAWAIQRRETVDALLEMPFYHPSIEEMLQSALKDAARRRAGR
ncbi:MAG: dihydrolipoyl dehydrogenase [Lautropia sp.]